jgi:hypothetical protein
LLLNDGNPMITLEPITLQNVWIFKAVRLQVLQDAPNAFGSTYANECTDADWIQRTVRWNGERGARFLAMDGSASWLISRSSGCVESTPCFHVDGPDASASRHWTFVGKRGSMLGLSKRSSYIAIAGHVE